MNSTQRYDRIAFVASAGAEAQAALAQLAGLYGNHDPDTADVVVALGGDGLMLQTLHRHMRTGKPIYGMHRGTVGFLMNEFSAHDEARDVRRVEVLSDKTISMRMLFDPGHSLEERILREQFGY